MTKEQKIILYIATTIDGFIAKPDGDVDFLDKYMTDEAMKSFIPFMQSLGAIVMGENTYTLVLTFGDWPYGDIKTYVISNKENFDPRVTFIGGDIKEISEKIRSETSKDIWLMGGANIVQQFADLNLIDEYVISHIPEKIGKGIKLWEGKNPLTGIEPDKIEVVNNIVEHTFIKKQH